MEKHMILVPTDFTAVGDTALSHGILIAEAIEGEITLLHVVGKKKEVEKAEAKLKEVIDSVSATTSIKITSMVKIGNIFDDIGGVAANLDAQLIFMGTHGAKGMQKLTGSYALKVITNSLIPFVVVQKRGVREGYKQIVIPIDLTKESVQQLRAAADLAKNFDSEIHILCERHNDPYLVNKIKRNVVVTKKFLNKEGVRSNIKITEGAKTFYKEVLSYASAVDADLISIVNDMGAPSMFGGFEQHILANDAQIPALIINALETTHSRGFLSV